MLVSLRAEAAIKPSKGLRRLHKAEATKATSFAETPQRYREALESAGFEVISERDRRETGAEFFRQMKARIAASGPPALGLHVLMGQDAPIKTGNMLRNLEAGCIAPVEMIARRS